MVINSKSYNIFTLIDECRKCCDNGFYLSALSTALILPDICAKIDIKLNNNGKEKSRTGVIYENWIDKWLSPLLPPINSRSSFIIDSTSWGKVIYKLRCGILHSSEIDVCGKNYKTFDLKDFDLFVGEKEYRLNAMKINNIYINIPGEYRNETRIGIDIRFLVYTLTSVVLEFVDYYKIEAETLMEIGLENQ